MGKKEVTLLLCGRRFTSEPLTAVQAEALEVLLLDRGHTCQIREVETHISTRQFGDLLNVAPTLTAAEETESIST